MYKTMYILFILLHYIYTRLDIFYMVIIIYIYNLFKDDVIHIMYIFYKYILHYKI